MNILLIMLIILIMISKTIMGETSATTKAREIQAPLPHPAETNKKNRSAGFLTCLVWPENCWTAIIRSRISR